ncbi:uncharacterized protein PHACADRAFT_256454 [Phanerochaete carnosa HHB-10118-sp]|uniref:Uncharacterized protein n=1 Tax=Phanerochaete carnosa (strain HHB-10118-sp) TaxID=650164 RepID=K5W9M1_PHACS|nr:uncharacterized protein PHACADRAFT_256454 [Phanerochaete carnosa HHB-10118-sp]EKM55669.1 hypothetical protein PHACADRAFT_256454 [Phanerochaete carnosa HHB-10118-sp]
MVQLCLTTLKGNAGSRHFPFQGYLGLTPVRIEGIVRTRLDEDQKPMQAKSITVSVRAYESRQTRMGATHTRLLVDYSQTLWKKPDDQPYADVGEFESPFRIVLPRRVAGFSTANYQDYRTYWRVEAVLEHVPLASVGTRLLKQLDILLIRHDIPPPLPPPSPSHAALVASSSSSLTPALLLATNKPRAPVLHYNLSTPTCPIGPSDLLITSLFIRPLDPSVTVRSASLLVERRIDLHDLELPPLTPGGSSYACRNASLLNTTAFAYLAPLQSSSTLDSAVSTSTVTSRTPLIPQTTSASSSTTSSPPSTPVSPSPFSYASPSTPGESSHHHKTLTSAVALAEGTSFAFDKGTGVWNKTISLQWPAARSHSRWAMGETMRGSLGAVSFWVRVKVIVTSPSGTESIDLAPRELVVVLTNDAERRHALAVFAEARSASKGRNSSSRPGTSTDAAPSSPTPDGSAPVYTPPKSAGTTASGRAPPASISTRSPVPPASPTAEYSHPPSAEKGQRKTKKPRRPHTSAGPRDSADVQVAGAIPVPVPLPVPTHGYASTPSSSPDKQNESDRGPRQPLKDGLPFLTRRSSEVSAGGARNSGDTIRSKPVSPRMSSVVSTSFVSASPAGPVSPPPRSSSMSHHDRDGLLLNTEVCAGVRMDKVQLNGVSPHPSREGESERRGRTKEKTELIRVWEEELAKIEKATRRGSNVLAFWRKRDKPKEQFKRERIAT